MEKVREKRRLVKRQRKTGILAAITAMTVMAGYGFHQPGSEALSGGIVLAGSSSMEDAANLLAESFMEKYPDVIVTVEFTGSSAGIEAVMAGSADIGNSSRYLKKEEREKGAEEHIIGFDGIAVCVDGTNGVADLTKEQLSDIFTGKVRNWALLGGRDVPVVVIGREAGSGTRSAFEELLNIEGRCTYANELDSTGAVLARIAVTPGAIGYVSFEAAERVGRSEEGGKVRAVSLDGAEPGMTGLEAGEYPLYRPFIMVTHNGLSRQSPVVRTWFAYVYGSEGRELLRKAGIVPGKLE